MRVAANTPALLIVDYVAWWFIAACLAWIACVIVPAVLYFPKDQPFMILMYIVLLCAPPTAMLLWAAQRHQLVFNRADGTLEMRKRSFRGYARQHFALSDVKRAYVGMSGPKNARIFVEVTRDMDAGHHVFPHMMVPVRKVQRCVDTIDAWLDQ